jgi:predicted TIM-barrel enzyme
MTAAGCAIRAAVKLPLGFNVLRNDAQAALALCAACGGDFIRVNVHTGAMLTDQGLIEGDAYTPCGIATASVRARKFLRTCM